MEKVNTKEHLKNFYHDDFISSLPEDSRLHKILTVDLPQTENLRIEINNCLELAQRYKLLDADLKARLRSPDGQIWQSAMDELRVALQFENLFGIDCLRWHPQGREKKVGEFELFLNKVDKPIFVEVKTVFPRDLERLEKRIIDKLHRYIEQVPFPFALDVHIKEIGMSENFSGRKFKCFLTEELSKINTGDTAGEPSKLADYRDDNTGLYLEITTIQVPPKPEQTSSYVGVIGGEARFLSNEEYIKHSLRKAYDQLPKAEQPCLVILSSSTAFPLGETNMLNALIGTLAVRIWRDKNMRPVKTETIRQPDGFFQPNRNQQLSAVGLYREKLTGKGVEKSLEIYHNLFASNPLANIIFKGKSVRQLVKKKDREMEWIN